MVCTLCVCVCAYDVFILSVSKPRVLEVLNGLSFFLSLSLSLSLLILKSSALLTYLLVYLSIFTLYICHPRNMLPCFLQKCLKDKCCLLVRKEYMIRNYFAMKGDGTYKRKGEK